MALKFPFWNSKHVYDRCKYKSNSQEVTIVARSLESSCRLNNKKKKEFIWCAEIVVVHWHVICLGYLYNVEFRGDCFNKLTFPFTSINACLNWRKNNLRNYNFYWHFSYKSKAAMWEPKCFFVQWSEEQKTCSFLYVNINQWFEFQLNYIYFC